MHNIKFYLLIGVLGLVVTTLSVSTFTFAQDNFGAGEAKFEKKLENLSPEQRAEFEARRTESETKRAEIDTIVANQDYDAWAQLMAKDGKPAEFITKENFAKFTTMHQLMKEGQEKFDQAQAIAQELGLGPAGKFGHGHGMMMYFHHAAPPIN